MWSRRSALGWLTLPLLAGCSSDPNSDTSQMTNMLGQSLDIFSGAPSLSLAEVARVPYASIGVRVGDSAQTLLVLATQTREVCLWTSAAHVAIETRAGRIMRAAGLPHDATVSLPGADPLQTGLQHLRGDAAFTFDLDLADRHAYQIEVQSRILLQGTEEIAILGTKMKTLHAEERCVCAALNWNFVNQYWCDGASGFVWRSTQNVHPDLDAIEIEVFRPPA